jgi:drug/metabolite transporter (DMT)-like permease
MTTAGEAGGAPRRGGMAMPTALLLIGGISFGSVFSANRLAVEAGLPALGYAFWQTLFAALLLLGAGALARQMPRFDRRSLALFLLVALTGMVGPLVVFVTVADKVPAGILTLIVALIPATTYALSLLLGMDRLRWLKLAGVVLGFAGVLLIVLPEGGLPTPEAVWWVLFALLVPVLAAVNNIYGERLSPPRVSSFAIAGGMMSVAVLVLFLVMMARDGFVVPSTGGWQGAIAILWSGTAQAITYCSFFEIVRRAGGVFFALINYVIVAAGLLWAYALFGERLSPWAWGAVALFALSLVLINLGMARARGRDDARLRQS